MNIICAIAHKEFRDGYRSQWVVGITVLFAALALGIGYFGATAAGRVGFTSSSATIASLTTLAGFVIPLVGLLVAHDTIVGERDRGTLPLILSYPLSRTDLAVGKLLGHAAVLAVSILAGFGIAMTVMQALAFTRPGLAAWADLLRFMESAWLLGASFIGLASLVSVGARSKPQAAGIALFLWFASVIAFDLLLLGVLIASGGNDLERSLFPYLVLLNPVDVFRLVNLTALTGGAHGDIFLAMTASHTYPPIILQAVLLAWAIAPAMLAILLFRKQEV